MYKCVVVLVELKLADITEKAWPLERCVTYVYWITLQCIVRPGNENPIWNAAHNKSDYKDNVRKFREEKNPSTVSFNCHVVNLVFTVNLLIQNLQHDTIIKPTLYDNYIIM